MKKTIVIYILVLVIVSMLPSMAATDTSNTPVIVISVLNQDPDPAIVGDVFEVRVGVENRGGVSNENLVLEFMPEYPFELVPGYDAVQKVGTVKSYLIGEDMKIVRFKARVNRDATAGEYVMKIKEYEEGKESASAINSISINIKSKESAEVIHIDKTTLVPGKQTSLKFVVHNVGSAPLRDLTFSWINEDKILLPVGSDNTKYIKYIDIGKSAELEYQVIADSNAAAGLYKLDLQLTYDDPLSEEEKEINTIAGVYVGGGTDFDVAFSESSSGQTSFTIANVGSNPAFSVSVIIPQQQNWRVSGSNSMIIGNLNKGDYTVASFGLQSTQVRAATTEQKNGVSPQESLVQRTMQAQTPLKVQIAYTDTMGERKLVEKEVNVNAQSLMASLSTDSQQTGSLPSGTSLRARRQQGFFSKYKWYIIILAVLLIVGISYWKYRKEKLLDPNFKVKDLFKIKNIFKKKKK